MRSIILLFLNIQGTLNFAISVKPDKKNKKAFKIFFSSAVGLNFDRSFKTFRVVVRLKTVKCCDI